MSFASSLDTYCQSLGCTNMAIAERCGISASALSRYRNGNRSPKAGSEIVIQLARGISSLGAELDVASAAKFDNVLKTLNGDLEGPHSIGVSLFTRLDALMNLLSIRNADLARALGVDPSYLSRIRSGQRNPTNQRKFVEMCSRFASQWCLEHEKLSELMTLIDSVGDVVERSHLDLDSKSDLAEVIENWLMGNNIVESDVVALEALLEKIESGEFAARRDELISAHIPPPRQADAEPFSRFLYGTDTVLETEVRFFEIARAHGVKEAYLSSDMPLLQMALNRESARRYQLSAAALIRSRCHINVIHSVEQPLAQTINALELWIPLYLTQKVTPYYLKGINNRVFCHVNYVCDACAVESEAVMGHQGDGRYYLTTKPDDIAYYKKKMGFILERTTTLIEMHPDNARTRKKIFGEKRKSGPAASQGREIKAGCYKNLRIMSYPGDRAVLTTFGSTRKHFVIKHPKLRYAIAHMD